MPVVSFPSNNHLVNYFITDTRNGSIFNKTLNSSLGNIKCRDDFIKIHNICQPRCDRFEQASHVGSQLLIYSELIASSFGLLVCILIVGTSIKNYKEM